MMPSSKLILLLFVNLVVGILIGHFLSNKKVSYESNYILPTAAPKIPTTTTTTTFPVNISSNVDVVNLNQSINASFKCMKTKTILNYFNSYICIHDTQKDVYVSTSFRESASIWEEEGVVRILRLLLRYPHLDFIDIGANIGSYTMYAAALGRFVLAIDCFAPNIDRIHRAVQLANVANRVVLIQNALYTHSGQYLRLTNDAANIGGQELDVVAKGANNQSTIHNESLINNPYIVKTIRFDELIPILIARGVRGAIIKMDIEGSESFAIESGSKVFDLLEIPVVQIEWLKVRNFPARIKVLIDFFTQRDYVPITFQCNLLDLNHFAVWPNDFCWAKRNITFC